MKYIILFFISLSTAVHGQNADINILKNINLNRNKNLDNTFITISNSAAPVSIALPIGILCTGLIKHDSTIKNKGI